MDGIARGTLVNLLTRAAGVGLMLAITAVTARIGTEAQGRFALFTTVESLCLALLSGFGVALARRVSHHGENPRGLVAAVALGCVALGLLLMPALWAFSAFGPPAYAPLWILALAAPLMLLVPNLGGLWLGEGRMRPPAVLALAPPLLCLAAVGAVALAAPLALPAVLGAWVGAKALVALALLWVLWRSGRLGRPEGPALRREARFIATNGATNLIGLANYRVGLVVAERFLDVSAVGVYSIAVIVAELMWFVSGSLTQAAYARIGAPDGAHAAAFTVRVMQLGVAALLLVAPLLWLGAWLLVPRLLGATYAGSLLPLALLLPGVLLFGAAGSLSAWFTNHAGRPEVPAQVAALSLAFNAGLALLLVPLWGIAGAALAASLAYGVSVVLLALRFARAAALPLPVVLRPAPQLWADLRRIPSRAGGRR